MNTLGNALAGLAAALAVAGTTQASALNADWAFPGPGARPATKQAAAAPKPHALPGSSVRIANAQLHDLFHAVDWHPERHPPAPPIVLNGRLPDAMACGFCHLPAGQGRPENAALAGLPAAYILEQLADMRSGARRAAQADWAPSGYMRQVAHGLTAREAAAAANYFSKLRFTSHLRVVEAARIPAMTAAGFIYRRVPGGAPMPLGPRIVEGPDDFERFELRDTDVGYTAYVPPGAIARGRRLADTGGHGRTQPCASCHGQALAGAAGPPLAGRSPSYLFRQLLALHTGARRGAGDAPMTAVTARLSTGDMIDLAAYAGSLRR